MSLTITSGFEKKDPEDSMSPVTARYLFIQTPISPESIDRIAGEFSIGIRNNYEVMGIENRITTIRIRVDAAAWSSFSRFLYELLNNEFGSAHLNR